jgi:hypothetical protein
MSENTIQDLRAHLFDTIRQLKDTTKPMEIARAKAISDTAKQIIDSAKVEVDMIRAVNGNKGTGFIPAERVLPAPERPVPASGPAQPIFGKSSGQQAGKLRVARS